MLFTPKLYTTSGYKLLTASEEDKTKRLLDEYTEIDIDPVNYS